MEISREDRDTIARIAKFEKEMNVDYYRLGWTWQDVQVWPTTLNRFIVLGLVRISFSSNSGKNYRLTDVGLSISEAEPEEPLIKEQIPIDTASLFLEIIGYDDLKELLRECLQLDKPVHILLHGPPSICKSQFLLDIEKAAGATALPLLGSATSHAGLWDLIAEEKPKYLLIDEIEKLALTDMAGLLSLMEQGRIIRAKVGRRLDIKLDVRVLAAANRINKLPPELLSRFAKFHLSEYNTDEYIAVVKGVLVRQEGLFESEAHEVAYKLVGKSHDIRDAIRVARLSVRVGVQRAIELLIRSEEDYR